MPNVLGTLPDCVQRNAASPDKFDAPCARLIRRSQVRYSHHSFAAKRLASPLLLLALLISQMPVTPVARAQTFPPAATGNQSGVERAINSGKVSPELLQDTRGLNEKDARVKVILQLNSRQTAALDLLLQRFGARTSRHFQNLNARAVELPARAIEALAAHSELSFISPDRESIPAGHISATSGSDAVRGTSGTNVTGLDGTGIGIAVLDSGIDLGHTSFLDRSNKMRVVANRDFTGENRIDDPYGHGTHVASIAAGNGRISNAQYLGIAPNASLINLRVLNSQGQGTVSGLLAALDWVVANRALYNIRVVNMSLGAPAVESYRNDPVCRAVRRLVDLGIVVVAAAGNNGKNSSGQKIYGAIHSPGNEPAALTVGASNTYGTDARNDDGVASFSSRGPHAQFVDGRPRHEALRQSDQARFGCARQQVGLRQSQQQLSCQSEPATRCGRQPGRWPSDDVHERFFNGDAGRRRSRRPAAASQSLFDAQPRQDDFDVHGAAALRLQHVRAGRRPTQSRRRGQTCESRSHYFHHAYSGR
jgi:hypothetical protein